MPPDKRTASKFQFHKGTIKTWLQRVIGFQNRYYFNSIKVRLKQSKEFARYPPR